MKQEYKWNVTNLFMKCIHVVLTLLVIFYMSINNLSFFLFQ